MKEKVFLIGTYTGNDLELANKIMSNLDNILIRIADLSDAFMIEEMLSPDETYSIAFGPDISGEGIWDLFMYLLHHATKHNSTLRKIYSFTNDNRVLDEKIWRAFSEALRNNEEFMKLFDSKFEK